jgi:DNA-binding transcriptional ArsR family regulator
MAGRTKAPGKKPKATGNKPEGTLTLTGLEQVWALSDPLRVKMLGAFYDEERTTRQVAEFLEEKPTRLYHHLKALLAAGLIRKTRTRRNRGTLETYYRAVAGSFRADPALFSPKAKDEATDSIGKAIDSMLDQLQAELRELIATHGGAGDAGRDLQEEAFFGFLEVRAPERDMRKLRAEIGRLVAGLQKDDPKRKPRTAKPAAPDRRYRLSITFFPLDLPKR